MSERTKKYLKDFKSKLSYTFLLSGGVSLIVLVIFALCGLFFFLTKDYGYSDLFSILIAVIREVFADFKSSAVKLYKFIKW